MSTINLFIHRFLDCDNFPAGVNVKVKQKMSTTNMKEVTCETCKRRITDSLANRNWRDLHSAEELALDVVALELSETNNG